MFSQPVWSLKEVQLLSGLLPICVCCKKLKDEHEVWQHLESYITARRLCAGVYYARFRSRMRLSEIL